MLDIRLITEKTEYVKQALAKRGGTFNLEGIISLDKQRREIITKTEGLKAKRNSVTQEISLLKRAKQNADGLIEQMGAVGEEIKELDAKLAQIESQLKEEAAALPNMPDDDIVSGGKENNEVIKIVGQKPQFAFETKNHVDLCTSLGLIDYERGAKLGGSGYWIYTDRGAVLEWALLNYFVEQHLADGYKFILPPHMLNYACGFGAGQFPKFAEDVYWIEENGSKSQFMLPTAETALVNLYAGEILPQKALPSKMFAYTPCYRKEAGSHRTEERGMIRGHQFNKVEMFCFSHPENSGEAFAELVQKASGLVENLGLHFRVSKLAAGDISASMARTYDIEVWLPSMGIYKEISSVSNSNDYQARRNNTRFREESSGRIRFVHTLNGSGLATSRLIPAIVEQCQNPDGSVNVPLPLQKRTGFAKIEKK